jgi:hypothetical protein
MECVGSPVTAADDATTVTHDNLVSLDKLQAEAGLSEVKTLLGWELDTRQLTVKLTQEKYETWTSQLHNILATNGCMNKKVLESLIGHLNHTTSIIPIAWHLLSHLYFSNSKATKHKPVFLNRNTILDLKLWIDILDIAKAGISMNLLTYQYLDITYWSDACKFGIGGYSSNGCAW